VSQFGLTYMTASHVEHLTNRIYSNILYLYVVRRVLYSNLTKQSVLAHV